MYHLKKFFLNFLLFIKNFLLNLSKKNLYKKNTSTKYASKASVNNAATFEIKSNTEVLKKEVETSSYKIIKKYYGDIEKTLNLLAQQGVEIYKIKSANKILKIINEKQGFLTPLRGFKALYLNFILFLYSNKKLIINTKTNCMFVFSKGKIDTFFLASQVYRYMAYTKNLPGFEYNVQEKFKKIYKNPNNKNFSSLTTGDIFALKEAIARDVESVDFAFKVQQENQISKNNQE